MANRPVLALCLGPHRCGTSAIAAAIQAAGAFMALPVDEGSPENPKGFFEHPGLRAMNDAVMARAASAWDDPLYKPRGALPDEADNLLAKLTHGAVSAVKDPRMARMLPLWRPRLSRFDLRAVLVTRNPVEAAMSQRRRCRTNPDFYDFGKDLAEGAALWLSYTRQMLRDTTGLPALVVDYADFMRRPREMLDLIAAHIGTTPDSAALDAFTATFPKPALHRNHASAPTTAKVEAAFPGLGDAARDLAARSGGPPPNGLFEREDWAETMAGLAARAYGRCADARRRSSCASTRLSQKALQLGQKCEALSQQRNDLHREAKATIHNLQEVMAQMASQHDALRLDKTSAQARAEAAGKALDDTRQQLARARQAEKALRAELSAQSARQGRAEIAVCDQKRRAETAEAELLAQQGRHDEDRTKLTRLSLSLSEKETEVDRLKQVLADMHGSHSWRITAPLRAAVQMARGAPRGAHGFAHRFARRAYATLKRRWPETAAALGRKLRPILPPPPPPVSDPLSPEQMRIFQRPEADALFRPLISVIVPNYNHAPYLRQRIDSILSQSYDHFELLLLDDASTDDSLDILREYARKDRRIRVLENLENSGGVFHQWEKGLREAKGDLVWIAESDDWAAPDFLETLVPFFRNEAVQLAFARNSFVDPAGAPINWSMEEYLAEFGADRWSRPWIETAPNIVREVFSMANIVPNAGSALIRRFDRLEVLESAIWRDMRICGDWLFYLNAIRGGLIAYTPATTAYYRIHPNGTSQRGKHENTFYQEHELIAKALRRHYRLSDDNLERLEARLRRHWQLHRGDYSDAAFSLCFDRRRVMTEPPRKPGLLMAGFAFAAGGGEVFPIHLANMMKAAGYEVTFLDFGKEPRETGIRDLLARDIPVVGNYHDLAQIVQGFDLDLIHSHHGWVDNTVLDLLTPGSPARTVVTLHGFYETMPAARLAATLPRLIKRSGAIVGVAEKNLDAMRRYGLAGPRLQQIDNRLPALPIHPVPRAQSSIPEDAFLVTQVSRAIPEKGWAEAIAAVKLAREHSRRDIHLMLIGEGVARQKALRADLPDFVHMPGFHPNPRDYFASADIALLASRFAGESAPLTVIEALAAGTPVLATDLGEVRQMLSTPDGPAGAVFPLRDEQIDVEHLARLIAELASDPLKLASIKARVCAASAKFDAAQMVREYDAVYLETARPKSKPLASQPRLARAAK